MDNTQEIKTIDFDDLDFLSQDNIFKKPTWIFISCEIDEPRCHSSFYRVLLSLVVRHFWVSVILNSLSSLVLSIILIARNRRLGGI
jgi:hypothetical protein